MWFCGIPVSSSKAPTSGVSRRWKVASSPDYGDFSCMLKTCGYKLCFFQPVAAQISIFCVPQSPLHELVMIFSVESMNSMFPPSCFLLHPADGEATKSAIQYYDVLRVCFMGVLMLSCYILQTRFWDLCFVRYFISFEDVDVLFIGCRRRVVLF